MKRKFFSSGHVLKRLQSYLVLPTKQVPHIDAIVGSPDEVREVFEVSHGESRFGRFGALKGILTTLR